MQMHEAAFLTFFTQTLHALGMDDGFDVPRDLSHLQGWSELYPQSKLALSNVPSGRDLHQGAAVPSSAISREGLLAPTSFVDRHALSLCHDLEALRNLMASFKGLGFIGANSPLVFGEGPVAPPVMVIGEAPGREESRQVRPFVGPSGALLMRMLKAIGLERDSVYITNAVPWQPPANRTPTPEELAVCLPFLLRHIELVKPRFLLLSGGVAAQALLGTKGVLSVRGRWFDVALENERVQAIVTLHPSYLLRQPAQKRLAWHDMKSLREALAS